MKIIINLVIILQFIKLDCKNTNIDINGKIEKINWFQIKKFIKYLFKDDTLEALINDPHLGEFHSLIQNQNSIDAQNSAKTARNLAKNLLAKINQNYYKNLVATSTTTNTVPTVTSQFSVLIKEISTGVQKSTLVESTSRSTEILSNNLRS